MQEEPSGVIVIDKPADITSARVIDVLKRVLGVRKAGHAGTLDPFATGVLVCCLNKATRLARFFLHGEKIYRAVLHLGIETDTQDSTGMVVARRDDVYLSEDTIRSVIKRFVGASWQQPPVIPHSNTWEHRCTNTRGKEHLFKNRQERFLSPPLTSWTSIFPLLGVRFGARPARICAFWLRISARIRHNT